MLFPAKKQQFPPGPSSGPWQHPQSCTSASCTPQPLPLPLLLLPGEIPSWAFVTDARVFLREVSISVNSNFFKQLLPRLLAFTGALTNAAGMPGSCGSLLRAGPGRSLRPPIPSPVLQLHGTAITLTVFCEGQTELGPLQVLGSRCSQCALGWERAKTKWRSLGEPSLWENPRTAGPLLGGH